MMISACVIVKNEERNIRTWLSNVSKVADEIIVVDTGSADSTAEIARQHGAMVYDYNWQDDFAAAKNYAIHQAKGEWILFLDADEYFSSDSIGVLRSVIEEVPDNVAMIGCRLINIDVDRNGKIIDSIIQYRLFRNNGVIFYKGAIHEQITSSLGKYQSVVTDKLAIYHTGYSSSIIKEKARRNLLILESKWSRCGDAEEKQELIPFLVDAYHSAGDYEKAIIFARRAIDNNLTRIGMAGYFYEVLFSAMQRAGYPIAEQQEVLDAAISKYPEEACFVIEKAYLLWQAKEFLEAEVLMKRGVELRRVMQDRLLEGLIDSDSSERLIPYIYECLGNIAYLKKNRQEAAELFLKGLKAFKYHGPLLLGLYKCISDSEIVELIAFFNGFYDREKDGAFICNALKGECSKQLYSYYSNKRNQPDADAFLVQGMYDAAAVVAARDLDYRAQLITANIIKGKDESATHSFGLLIPEPYKRVLYGKAEHYSRQSLAVLERLRNL